MRILILCSAVCLLILGCTHSQAPANDWAKYYQGRTGSFVLYHLQEDQYQFYQPERCKERFIPASTFKIFNSLVALETAVIPDESYEMAWDSVNRQVKVWNQNHDLRSAFRYSVVWYYQELARRIGEERMQAYIDREGYGNQDISAGIDLFWLSGGIRISPLEQVELLKKLYLNQLGFSQRNMDIVKHIMILESGPGYTLRGKTGWSNADDPGSGWFVGYLEKGEEVWFFANQIDMPANDPGAVAARTGIARAILQAEGLLPNEQE